MYSFMFLKPDETVIKTGCFQNKNAFVFIITQHEKLDVVYSFFFCTRDRTYTNSRKIILSRDKT